MLVKAEKCLFFPKKIKISSLLSFSCTYIQTLCCKSYIIYKKTLMYKPPRSISALEPPLNCTYLHCTTFPTFTCLKSKSHFLRVTSQKKVFNYLQLIRSDGTPPTQAPPVIPPPPPLPPVHIHEARSPPYEVAVFFSQCKEEKRKGPRFWAGLLVAGSPQRGALVGRGSVGVSVGQQSLPELRLTVRIRVTDQLDRLVERVVHWRGAGRRLSRSVFCQTKTGMRNKQRQQRDIYVSISPKGRFRLHWDL